MIKKAIFCDLCKKHILDNKEGTSFFTAGHKIVLIRKFESTGINDLSLCFTCQDSLIKTIQE